MNPKPTLSQNEKLELQLAGVFEQDGITLATPTGLRRRSVSMLIGADEVRAHDEMTVKQLISFGRVSRTTPKPVQVRVTSHARSEFVVSLQHLQVAVPKQEQERSGSWHDAMQHSSQSFFVSPGIQSYASATVDVATDLMPWDISDQFTAETFEQAFQRAYGRFDRLHRFAREIGFAVSTLVTRVERVETSMADAIDGTLAVIDIPRFSYARAVAGFAALACIVTLPANAVALYRTASVQKTNLEQAGAGALASLTNITPTTADESLRQASNDFRIADTILSESNALAFGMAAALPSTYRSAQALIEAGEKSAQAARLLSEGFRKIFSQDDGRRLTDRLDVFQSYLGTATTLLREASGAANSVNASSVPAEIGKKLPDLQKQLEVGSQSLRELSGLTEMLGIFAGKNEARRYLVFFQNPTELRPTGGFLGSFAEVVVDRGSIEKMSIPSGGTYDVKGQLLSRIAPPKPLQLIAPVWQMQDANWSPDFPTSAQRIRTFWSQSGGPTIDGVVAINATLLGKLLEITGPISMPEYGKTITSENFLLEMQKAVELEYDKEANTPKKFVADLAEKMRTNMSGWTSSDWLKASALFSDAMQTKDVQMALFHAEEEAQVEQWGWNGRVKPVEGDALSIIETNIAGQKTDGVIEESGTHHVEIHEDGSVSDSISLTRTHNGISGELFRGVRNVSYVRVYVPRGSVLTQADGFETPAPSLFKKLDDMTVADPEVSGIEATAHTGVGDVQTFEESGRTVFAGWLQLDPGKTQTMTLSYRLPLRVHAPASEDGVTDPQAVDHVSYVLLSSSQSGRTRTMKTIIDYPANWKTIWDRGIDEKTDGHLTASYSWNQDRVFSLLFNRHAEATP